MPGCSQTKDPATLTKVLVPKWVRLPVHGETFTPERESKSLKRGC